MGDRRWGRWTTTDAIGQWMADNLVEWRGVLTLPAELPAGDYRLWAGLHASTAPEADAVPLAEFSISENDPAIVIQP